MNWIWEQLNQILSQNEFMQGGMVLMILGGALAYARSLPYHILRWLKLAFVVELSIANIDATHLWTQNWLSVQNEGKCSRRLTAFCKHRDGRATARVTPGPGWHWYWFEGTPIIIDYSRRESKSVGNTYIEEYEMQFITFSRKVVPRFVEYIHQLYEESHKDKIKIYNATRHGDWDKSNDIPKRKQRSVILPLDQEEDVYKDVENFLSNREWYEKHFVPYRRGYLLTGPPGNGKSSLVNNIASEFGLDIYILTLGSKELDDDTLILLLADLPEKCILLLEDIDCVYNAREGETVSLSAMLNAIDGVNASEGRILIMTSNHPEKLDYALIRDGRVDRTFEINNPNDEQIERMFHRFREGDATEFVKEHSGKCMAEIQGRLLRETKITQG